MRGARRGRGTEGRRDTLCVVGTPWGASLVRTQTSSVLRRPESATWVRQTSGVLILECSSDGRLRGRGRVTCLLVRPRSFLVRRSTGRSSSRLCTWVRTLVASGTCPRYTTSHIQSCTPPFTQTPDLGLYSGNFSFDVVLSFSSLR